VAEAGSLGVSVRRHVVGKGTIAAAVAALVLSAATAASAGDERHFERKGIGFDYPASWYVTTRPLSNGVQPIYRFALANFRVHRTPRDLGPCLEGIARQRRPDRVLAFMREATGTDAKLDRFPRRPRSFPLPRRDDQVACLGPGTSGLLFRDSGRAFYLWISVGPNASAADKRALRQSLDGMTIARRP
jgi:hypothetical protein